MKPDDYAREVAIHERLVGHPNIVQMEGFSVGSTTVSIPRNIPLDNNDRFAQWRQGNDLRKNQTVMLLEHCQYGDLFNLVEANGAIKDHRMLKFIFLQICEGLKALHEEAGMAHMDIKLENVLVT